jgi:CRP/FNR family transcriptional regulator, cyclic AMP receptor protein
MSSVVPTLQQQAVFLSRVPLFMGMEPRLLEVLAGIMTLGTKPANTVLCKQGDLGDACFIIGKGKVDVVVGESTVATLGAGRVVGDVALIDGKRRSASVRCATDVTLFTLRRDDFERLLFAGNPASMRLLDNLVRELSTRVRGVNDQLTKIFDDASTTEAVLLEKLKPLRAAGEATAGGTDRDFEG